MLLIKNIIKHSRVITLLCFFYYSKINSQVRTNLIPNPSMELYSSCPNGFGGVWLSNYWFLPTLTGTSDYFNSCASPTSNVSVPNNIIGKQSPRTGNGYFGFSLFINSVEGRENVEIGLKNTLILNKNYCVTFYVSLAEESRFAISNIGAYFTKDSLKNYYPPTLPNNYFFSPHVENSNSIIIKDTLNWVQVQGTYLSSGIENFITIGNFKNDVNTNKIQIKYK